MFFRALTFIIVLGLGTVVFSFAYELPAGTGTRTKESAHPDDITVGFVGDMVPSLDPLYNTRAFTQVAGLLAQPDLMIGNLEGTFAPADSPSKCVYIKANCYAFRGDASFADSMKNAGIDFVSLVNNHSYDYGDKGLAATIIELERVGIPYVAPTKPVASIKVKGKRIGILGLSSTEPARAITDYDFITNNVAKLKATHDFVIVIFHGGSEGADKTAVPGTNEYMGTEDRGNVQLVAYTAIDAGADLVLGAGPHVLRKTEAYKEKPIAYSLGNFVGGNGALVTTGTLGVSGIYTGILSTKRTYAPLFTSVLLTADGIPAIDPLDQGLQLLKQLSQ